MLYSNHTVGTCQGTFSRYKKKNCHIHNEYRSAQITAEVPLVQVFPKWYGNFRGREGTFSSLSLLKLVIGAFEVKKPTILT